jgi:ATP-dependent protease ClpP protease subunit
MSVIKKLQGSRRLAKDDDEGGTQTECYHKAVTAVNTTTHYYISSFIDEAKYYIGLIHDMETAGPGDTIVIHLNTTGGNLATGAQIITAMRRSNAHIITSIDGECFSLGTLIFLSGDEFWVSRTALVMIHNYSGGETGGKSNDQMAQIVAINRWFDKLVRDIYIPFLSSEEVDRVLRGEDLWMNYDEIVERLERVSEPHESRALLDHEESDSNFNIATVDPAGLVTDPVNGQAR